MATKRSRASDKAQRPAPRQGNPDKRPVRRRKLRARPVPEWLMDSKDLDAIAQRRCLLVLSVLSGEKPVTEAIAEVQISRGLYYQLETRALRGMLSALMPGVSDDGGASTSQKARIESLEAKVQKLEKDKRRAERLLFMMRQVMRPGSLTTGAGRPPKSKNKSSTTHGPTRSAGSRTTSASKKREVQTSPNASTPMQPSAAVQ